MRRTAVAIALALATTTSARGQTTTSAGIEAYLRGEFGRAAELLQPAAEDVLQSDYAAAFFMATMYESGRGVGTDLTRACALYLRAAEGPAFQAQSVVLWRATSSTLSDDDRISCQWLAYVGFNHGFRKTTFELEPGYWITWDLKERTISYQGQQKRLATGREPRGTRYLPILHTDLTVGPTRSVHRHFFEYFSWMPSGNPRTWRLRWRLEEAVRDSMVPVTDDVLATVIAAEPPAVFEVRDVVSLRTTDAGEAELAIVGGEHPHTAIIDTEAERSESQQRQDAKQQRLKSVDWKKPLDPQRPPSFAYVDNSACSRLIAGWSTDMAEAIIVRSDSTAFNFKEPLQTLDIAAPSNGLEVVVQVYEKAAPFSFCSDLLNPMPGEVVWKATRGVISIQSSAVAARVKKPAGTRALIRIDGLEVVSPSGIRARPATPIVLTADINRLPGG